MQSAQTIYLLLARGCSCQVSASSSYEALFCNFIFSSLGIKLSMINHLKTQDSDMDTD